VAEFAAPAGPPQRPRSVEHDGRTFHSA
jgi:hypothetical protein